jgi:hypothetical protein
MHEAVHDGVLPLLQDLISIFNDSELELLVCGLPEIDTDDLRANTEYTGYTPSSAVVQYFWEVSPRPCSGPQLQQLLLTLAPVSAVCPQHIFTMQGCNVTDVLEPRQGNWTAGLLVPMRLLQ